MVVFQIVHPSENCQLKLANAFSGYCISPVHVERKEKENLAFRKDMGGPGRNYAGAISELVRSKTVGSNLAWCMCKFGEPA